MWAKIIETAVNLGTHAARSHLKSNFGNDHIRAQNETGQFFNEVLEKFNRKELQAAAAASQIKTAAEHFANYASQFGSRGQAGARELTELASHLIEDIGAKAGSFLPLPETGPTPFQGPSTNLPRMNVPFSSASSFTEYVPYIVLGVAAFYLLRKR